MNSVWFCCVVALTTCALGLCAGTASFMGYDDNDQYQQKEEAERLIRSLGDLSGFGDLEDSSSSDYSLRKYFDLFLRSALKSAGRQPSQNVGNSAQGTGVLPSSYSQKLRDYLGQREEHELLEQKRQAGSGAQICIWKVCPPSPWRRAGRPQAGRR